MLLQKVTLKSPTIVQITANINSAQSLHTRVSMPSYDNLHLVITPPPCKCDVIFAKEDYTEVINALQENDMLSANYSLC